MLFKRQQKSTIKKELLIFLTPHIVQSPNEMASLTDRERQQHPLINKSLSEDELERFLEKVPVKKDKK